MNEEFVKKIEKGLKQMPPDMKQAVAALREVATKFDTGWGGFVYKGKPFVLAQPCEETSALFIIAMQIDSLAKATEQSHLAVLSEVNEALRIIRDVEKK